MTLMKWSYSGTTFLLSQACQWRDIWHFHVSDLHPDEAVWSALCSKHLWPRVIGERLPWWILKESLIPHLGFKRVISRGCPHVPCLKVEPVYPWALSWGHDELLLDHSFHSLLNIVLLTFPMLNFCCEPLLKQKCPLFSFLKRFFKNFFLHCSSSCCSSPVLFSFFQEIIGWRWTDQLLLFPLHCS